jgi:tetratricopeptide (TPR) repeat protein
VVGNLARTRLLVPDGLGEDGAERLEALGSLAVDRDPDSTDHLETYGAALYRAGKYREAAEQLQAAVDNSDGQGSVWVQCFLAMTYYQLRDEKEEPLFSVGAAAGPLAWAHLHRTHEQSARDWLTKAVRQIENKENPDWKSSNGSDRKPDWESRVQWFYLRREAEATLRWSVPPGKTRHW